MKGSWKLSESDKNLVVAYYNQGWSSDRIAIHFNMASSSIKQILHRRNVPFRDNHLSHRKYHLNENAFDPSRICDPRVRYWIGMLITDGSVHFKNGCYTTNLLSSVIDNQHIIKFKEFLNTDIPIDYRSSLQTYGYCTARLNIYSTKIAEDLKLYGVVPNKTHSAKVLYNLDMDKDFWRGVVDGDGWIGEFKNRTCLYPEIGLCGSYSLMEQFASFIKSILPEYSVTIHKHYSIFRVSISWKKAIKVIDYLYSNSSVALDRKYSIAMALLQKYKLKYSRAEKHKDE